MNEYIKEAITQAKKSIDINEVPVGAVIVSKNEIIGYGYNSRERDGLVTSHAEIQAINMASKHLNTWKLEGCTIYVTLEPCMMCMGAIIESRIDKLYYVSESQKKYYNLINRKIDMQQYKDEEIDNMLSEFFKTLR